MHETSTSLTRGENMSAFTFVLDIDSSSKPCNINTSSVDRDEEEGAKQGSN